MEVIYDKYIVFANLKIYTISKLHLLSTYCIGNWITNKKILIVIHFSQTSKCVILKGKACLAAFDGDE